MNERISKRIIAVVLVVLLILFASLLILKIFNEDDWICKEGNWVKHGNPSASMPSEPCNQIVGGDRDEYGCIGSAGYSWCEEKQKCLRIWEENCSEEYTRKGILFSDAVKNCSFIYRGAMTEAHSYCDDVYSAVSNGRIDLCDYAQNESKRTLCLNFTYN